MQTSAQMFSNTGKVCIKRGEARLAVQVPEVKEMVQKARMQDLKGVIKTNSVAIRNES